MSPAAARRARVAPALAALAPVALALAALVALVTWVAGCGGDATAPAGDAPAPVAPVAEGGLTLPVDLYFPGSGGRLYREPRELPASADPEELIRELLGELLAGPRSPGLMALFPVVAGAEASPAAAEGADSESAAAAPGELAGEGEAEPRGISLGAVHLATDGVAYIDLRSPGGAPPPPCGSRQEIQAVFSLVNSVVLNVPEARSVALLWNGAQRPTFAGHVDTSRPLLPATELVDRR